MKQRHFIDSHKGVTLFFILSLMGYYQTWDQMTIWAYLATHGSYGLMWVCKSYTFPDKQWEQPCHWSYGLYIWAGLTLYWITPWCICHYQINTPPAWIAFAFFMYAVGVFFHFVADMQKHVQLTLKPGLFYDGLWARSRNPNYLGEFLIYTSFAVMAYDYWWVSASVLSIFMVIIWIPNMLKKDRSLSRYDDFAEYKKKSGLLFPKL